MAVELWDQTRPDDKGFFKERDRPFFNTSLSFKWNKISKGIEWSQPCKFRGTCKINWFFWFQLPRINDYKHMQSRAWIDGIGPKLTNWTWYQSKALDKISEIGNRQTDGRYLKGNEIGFARSREKWSLRTSKYVIRSDREV